MLLPFNSSLIMINTSSMLTIIYWQQLIAFI
nr:MAG TPA: hypothetical protein [Caudoviricetes sp.]DAX19632.1 MAG TPA: hypothetical protein [Caudoviricetes sp.]